VTPATETATSAQRLATRTRGRCETDIALVLLSADHAHQNGGTPGAELEVERVSEQETCRSTPQDVYNRGESNATVVKERSGEEYKHAEPVSARIIINYLSLNCFVHWALRRDGFGCHGPWDRLCARG
jgi:hypothetical protein